VRWRFGKLFATHTLLLRACFTALRYRQTRLTWRQGGIPLFAGLTGGGR